MSDWDPFGFLFFFFAPDAELNNAVAYLREVASTREPAEHPPPGFFRWTARRLSRRIARR
jgi:hypothetical protein